MYAARELGRAVIVRAGGRTRVALALMAALALPLAVFIPLGVKARQKDAFGWDTALSREVHAYENRETLLNRYVDVLGVVLSPATQLLGALVVLAVLAVLVSHGHRRAALFLALSVGGAIIAAPLLKELFQRPPVDPNSSSGYSFPSGHALRSMAAAAALLVVAWSTAWRLATLIVGAIAVALTGVGVVYHEWHWATDVIAAWCLSFAWVASVWLAVRPVYAPPDVDPHRDPNRAR